MVYEVLFSHGMRGVLPDHRLNLGPQHWEHGVLAIVPPGKFPLSEFICFYRTFLETSTFTSSYFSSAHEIP